MIFDVHADSLTPYVERQQLLTEYLLRRVMDGPNTRDPNAAGRLRTIVHGAGGCGKSVVLRALAHQLRSAGKGVLIAAPTGVAAANVNGATLHSLCSLPVTNQSYGRACDVPPPSGVHLENMKALWRHVDVLLIDEISFVSAQMLEKISRHLQLARGNILPFGGVHVVVFGDLYQLPPPKGHPCYRSKTWELFELCELDGNQRAARDPDWAALLARLRVGEQTRADIATLKGRVAKKRGGQLEPAPAPGAVRLYAEREAVEKSNSQFLEELVNHAGLQKEECKAVDTYARSGLPSLPENS